MNRSYDMAFSIVEENYLADDIWYEVITHSKHSLVALACVNKQLEILAKNFAVTYRPEGCFGKIQWLSFNGDPGDESFLPLKMIQDFDPKHQMLTFIPKTINNEPLTLTAIDCLVCKCKGTVKSNIKGWHNIDETLANTHAHWVLISQNILPVEIFKFTMGFEVNKRFNKKLQLFKKQGFEIPTLIDAVVSLLMHNLKTNEFVFPGASNECLKTVTYVQQKTCVRNMFKFPLYVGGFDKEGLVIDVTHSFFTDYGFASAKTSLAI